MNDYGLNEFAKTILYDKLTNEIIMVFWNQKEIQNKVNKLLKLRDKAKKKRIRKKLNSKVKKILEK